MFYFLFLVLFIGFGLLAQDIPEQKILVLYNEQPQQKSNTGLERQRYQETMKLEVAVITRCWLNKLKKIMKKDPASSQSVPLVGVGVIGGLIEYSDSIWEWGLTGHVIRACFSQAS